jgi:hypothetical protein
MADLKISQLTGATTPLGGTEELPLVQSSTTKKVTVANLTAGRAMTAGSLSTGTTDVFAKVGTQLSGGNAILTRFNSSNKPAGLYTGGSSGESFLGANLEWSSGNVFNYKLTGMMWYMGDPGGGGSSVVLGVATGTAGNTAGVDDASTVKFRWGTDGSYTLVNGNVVIGTAAKGINFTANTNAPGMTSELLNWYEEGTWTPNQGAGLTVVGAFSSSGTYVRIGRLVNVNFVVSGATSIAATGGSFLTTNLPFSILAGDAPIGQATNAAPNASVALFSFTTSVIPVNSIAATTSIRCSLTYQV